MSGGRTERHTDSEYLMSGVHDMGEINKIIDDYGLDAKEFSDWTATRSSITANSIIAPDGTLTGVKLTEDGTAANSHYLNMGTESISDDTSYTWSGFVLGGTKNRCILYIDDLTTAIMRLQIDVVAGTVATVGTGDVTIESSSITPYPDDWYLATITGQFANADSGTFRFRI